MRMKVFAEPVKLQKEISPRRSGAPESEPFVQMIRSRCLLSGRSVVAVPLSQVIRSHRMQVGDDQPDYPSRLENPPALQKKPLSIGQIQVLEYMGSVDGRESVFWKREAFREVVHQRSHLP